jgi:hypothetical protein
LKAPNSKIQAPEKRQIPNFKPQREPSVRVVIGALEISLELGSWNLELGSSPTIPNNQSLIVNA